VVRKRYLRPGIAAWAKSIAEHCIQDLHGKLLTVHCVYTCEQFKGLRTMFEMLLTIGSKA
jgi:hypothetical protein